MKRKDMLIVFRSHQASIDVHLVKTGMSSALETCVNYYSFTAEIRPHATFEEDFLDCVALTVQP